jgi:all-trans-retinol 13,14-reductase
LATKYDHIVVGSGVSGLTMTLLLAMSGRRVLLLEKAPAIGGSLSRFYKKGVPFETGFHFTGGLHKGGILDEILTFLGIRDAIEPLFLSEACRNQFIFETSGKRFELPSGVEELKQRLKAYFPGDAQAVDRYFDMTISVCNRTPSLNLHDGDLTLANLDEDYVSLDAVLRDLTGNELLRGLLSGYAMCYGVRPRDISFANHSRMVLNFYQSIACVKNGGDAFIKAFRDKLKNYNVDIRCSTFITELADIKDSKVGRFVLNTGEEVEAESCILTIHPKDILNLLPEKHFSRAFANRVSSFESSVGFFALFAVLKPGTRDPNPDASLVSFFPDNDVNNLLDPAYQGMPALVIIKSPDDTEESSRKGICILEPSFYEQVADWSASRRGNRPQGYIAYKKKRVETIKEHIFSVIPAYRECLDVLDAGSMLTFKDYLNSPDGSAYGVKQKMGQFNVIGKLPLHNLYAAGQSSLLPGIIGGMMSSLVVGRAVIGKEAYRKMLGKAS